MHSKQKRRLLQETSKQNRNHVVLCSIIFLIKPILWIVCLFFYLCDIFMTFYDEMCSIKGQVVSHKAMLQIRMIIYHMTTPQYVTVV